MLLGKIKYSPTCCQKPCGCFESLHVDFLSSYSLRCSETVKKRFPFKLKVVPFVTHWLQHSDTAFTLKANLVHFPFSNFYCFNCFSSLEYLQRNCRQPKKPEGGFWCSSFFRADFPQWEAETSRNHCHIIFLATGGCITSKLADCSWTVCAWCHLKKAEINMFTASMLSMDGLNLSMWVNLFIIHPHGNWH